MVKKKVSKTSHSKVRFNKSFSNNNSSNKRKENKKVSRNVVKNSKINDSKNVIEQINPTTNDNKLLMSTVESSSEKVSDIKDTNTINTQVTSKENTSAVSDVKVPVLNENVSQTINDSKILKIFGMVLVLVILVFWMTVLLLSINIYTGPKMFERNVTLLSYVPIDSSFEEFLIITDNSYNKSISISGYLYKETIAVNNSKYINNSDIATSSNNIALTSNISRYIVDINNNRIPIILNSKDVEEYDGLFLENTTRLSMYDVTGIYFYDSGEYFIVVDNISKINNIIDNGKRLLREVKIQKMENISEGDESPGVSFNIERGIVRIFSIMS